MSGFVIVVGLFLAVSIIVGTVRATVGRVGAGGLRVAAGVVALIILALTAVMSSVRYVGKDYIGIVIKNVAFKDLPQGQILATEGEKGPQAGILGPGWRPGLWPIVFDVEKVPVVEIDDRLCRAADRRGPRAAVLVPDELCTLVATLHC